MSERRKGVRSLAVVAAVAAALVVPAATPALAQPADVSTVLTGGVGDGGPADEALVGTGPAAVLPDGHLVFADARSHQIREFDPATGTVDALYGLAYSTWNVPVAPVAGADVNTVRLPLVTGLWVTDDDDVWVTFKDVSGLHRIDADTHTVTRWWSEMWGNGISPTTSLVTVTPAGALVLSWRDGTGSTGYTYSTRVYPPSDAPPTTAPQVLWDRSPGAMTADHDGNLYEVRGGGIWRIDGTEESLVAGVDGPRPAEATTRPDGVPALGAAMAPRELRWVGDGRIAYTESAPQEPGVPGTPMYYRVLDLGGDVRTVVGPFGTDSLAVGAPCTGRLAQAAVVDGRFLLGCGGAFRSWDLDGSDSSALGAPLVGSVTGSPAGTPSTRAYVPGISDLAVEPGSGQVTIETGTDIRRIALDGSGGLERLAGDGQRGDLVEDGEPATSGSLQLTGRLAYGADGTLYLGTYAGEGLRTLRVRALAEDGTLSTVLGGGVGPLAEGATATGVDLTGFYLSLTLQPYGSLLAFGPVDGVVWGVDPATGRVHRLVGGGSGPAADGSPADGAALEVDALLGSQDTGALVVQGVADGVRRVYRVDAAGTLHPLSVPTGGGVALSDGSFVVHDTTQLLRFADGVVTPLAGTDLSVDPPDSLDGVYSLSTVITSDGAGGVVAVDQAGLSPRLIRATPAASSPRPAVPVTVRSTPDGLVFTTAQVPAGSAMHLRIAVARGAAPGSWRWENDRQYVDAEIPADGRPVSVVVGETEYGGDLVSGTVYGATVWEWQPDAMGSPPSQAFQVTYWDDTTAPTASMTGPAARTTLSTAVHSAWTGSDSESGVSSYDVRYRVASGRYAFSAFLQPATLQGTTATSSTVTGVPGKDYCFSVRARDHAGQVSSWSSERCTTVPLDDRSLTVGTTVTRAASTAAWQGTISRAHSTGARWTRTDVTASKVGLVVTTCHGCGSVDVSLGGVRLGRISLESSTTQRQVRKWLPSGPLRHGTLVVQTRSGSWVFVDGLLSIRQPD